MKTKVNSRKADCPTCRVHTGSHHNKSCIYAYALPNGSKRLVKKLTLPQKIKQIIEIIKN